MLTFHQPVISISVSLARAAEGTQEAVVTPRAAQVRLAEVLAEADAVHGVGPIKRHAIAIALDCGGVSFRAVATTRKNGDIVARDDRTYMAIPGRGSGGNEL